MCELREVNEAYQFFQKRQNANLERLKFLKHKIHNFDHKTFLTIPRTLIWSLLRFREKWSRAREREELKRSKENAKEERKRSREVDMMMLFEEEPAICEEEPPIFEQEPIFEEEAAGNEALGECDK